MTARFFNIFLQTKWIFRLSPLYKTQQKSLKILHDFTDSVIIARRQELVNEAVGAETKFDESEGKKKLALLDVLLRSSIDGQSLSNEDIREEVDTFIFEGHDTTTSAIAFCLYNLAKFPEVQQKAYEEVKNLHDHISQPMTQKDLNDLHYMELVIKETLRLYPSVPFYGREVQEDIEISMEDEIESFSNLTFSKLSDGKFIPKKTNLIVAAVAMGRMENIWEDAEAFIPERFLFENTKANLFAFVPFSAGSRNCIGQKFAMLEMKIILSKILSKFTISKPDDYEPILVSELILRPENGLMISLRKR